MLPGCDYNRWLIVIEFPKDPSPTREQMIDTYLDTLATVLGRSAPFSLSLSLNMCVRFYYNSKLLGQFTAFFSKFMSWVYCVFPEVLFGCWEN